MNGGPKIPCKTVETQSLVALLLLNFVFLAKHQHPHLYVVAIRLYLEFKFVIFYVILVGDPDIE